MLLLEMLMDTKLFLASIMAVFLYDHNSQAATTFLPDWQQTGLNFEANEGVLIEMSHYVLRQ